MPREQDQQHKLVEPTSSAEQLVEEIAAIRAGKHADVLQREAKPTEFLMAVFPDARAGALDPKLREALAAKFERRASEKP